MSLFTLAGRVVDVQSQPRELRARAAPKPGEKSGGVSSPPPSVVSALQQLVDFIPTETITLFWLAVPATKSLYSYLHPDTPWSRATDYDWVMLAFLIAMTPVLLILAYLSGVASKRLPRPPLDTWPWWKALAATIAFTFWAFAVPGNPFLLAAPLLMSAWVVATLVSMLLGLIDPMVMEWGRR